MRADELDVRVLHGAFGVALAISIDVAKVTNMSGLVGGSTVGLAVRVDWLRSTCTLVTEAPRWYRGEAVPKF